jgi:hypothetical protein
VLGTLRATVDIVLSAEMPDRISEAFEADVAFEVDVEFTKYEVVVFGRGVTDKEVTSVEDSCGVGEDGVYESVEDSSGVGEYGVVAGVLEAFGVLGAGVTVFGAEVTGLGVSVSHFP